MKDFLKAAMVCGCLLGSFQAVGGEIEYFFKTHAPLDLARLKGCGETLAYDGYLRSLTKALEVSPEINHAKIPEFLRILNTQVENEYYLMGYPNYLQFEASGRSGPNPHAWLLEKCPEDVKKATLNRIKINDIAIKALSR
ncbi:hypothetical protein [Pseudomonas coronafaciens]|uniref:hypothetical protein n=1 Tax=Pseudomonas coronafaciens TaxID=53409 RepID=UPI0011C37197|nr:hypothetical protein [Pseudomonas coronafaciens]